MGLVFERCLFSEFLRHFVENRCVAVRDADQVILRDDAAIEGAFDILDFVVREVEFSFHVAETLCFKKILDVQACFFNALVVDALDGRLEVRNFVLDVVRNTHVAEVMPLHAVFFSNFLGGLGLRSLVKFRNGGRRALDDFYRFFLFANRHDR